MCKYDYSLQPFLVETNISNVLQTFENSDSRNLLKTMKTIEIY